MMKRSSAIISLAVVMAAGITACGGSESAPLVVDDGPFGASARALTASEAEARATEVVDGTVISTERERRRSQEIFEVYVLTNAGTVISVYLLAEAGEILEVEQQSEGPVPDLRIGEGYIFLSEAIDMALEAQSGTVIRWALERDDASSWAYELYIRAADGRIYEVEIDARSGALLEVELDSEAEDDVGGDGSIQNNLTSATRAQAEAVALGFIDGRIESIDVDTDYGYRVWSVDVERASGAEVELELLDPSLALLSAEGTDGPFDYDFDPGPDYLSLSEARAAAPNADGYALDSWSFERDDGRMVWTLEYGDGEVEVEVDAITAEVLEVDRASGAEGGAPTQDGRPSAGRAQVETGARGFIQGPIASIDVYTEDGDRDWSVDVYLASGAEIELDLDPSLTLLSAEGTDGPFDYDFDPGAGYLSLAEARATVRNAEGYALDGWSFDRDDGRVFYTLQYDDGELDFEIDALTGELLP